MQLLLKLRPGRKNRFALHSAVGLMESEMRRISLLAVSMVAALPLVVVPAVIGTQSVYAAPGGGGAGGSPGGAGPGDSGDPGGAGANGASPGGSNPSGIEGNQGNGPNAGAGNAG